MLTLSAIAFNTFKEALHERVLHVLILFACLAGAAGVLLGSLSIAQELRILVDLGLFAIGTIGGVIAVFLGASLFHREVDQGTIALVFTKPLRRWQFVSGKFLGLSGCLALVIAGLGALLVALIWVMLPDRTAAEVLLNAVCLSVAMIYLESLLVLAAALFFATFTSPVMSIFFTLAFWLIAHFSPSLLTLGQMSTSAFVSSLAGAVYYSLPDLSAMSKTQDELMRWYEITRHSRLEGVTLPFDLVAARALPMVLTYIFGYILLLLSVGTYITERREFN